MCGLFGGISGRGAPDINIIKTLGILNQERGEDSCGISFGHTLLKGANEAAKWTKFIQKNKIEFKPSDHVVIGHVRRKTQGLASEKNAHPFKIPIINKEGKDYCIIGAHNGNITNWRELCTKAGLTPADYEVDSHAAYALIGRSFRKGDYSFFENYVGKAALMWTFSDEDAIYVFHGRSMDNNTTLKDTVSEERPLHYWVDTKKNVTYFSSEAEPLHTIAANNEEVLSVPHNQILKFTSNSIEVIADIDRDTKSYQNYWENSNYARNNVSRMSTRNVDNGDFDRRINGPSMQLTIPKVTDDGIIMLPTNLITDMKLKATYVPLVDIKNLEDKFENGCEENRVVFVKSRYYRNGHLADGIMYLDKNGKISNKRFNKKDLTVSVNEDGINVPYSRYYFCDGLLFASEADHTKYLKIIKKGVKASEARTLPSEKPRSAHADFIKRVAKEGVKFLAPVSTYDMLESSIILPKGIKESKEIWNEKIPFTGTQFIIHDGKLKAIIYPDRKQIIADKQKVVFSISERSTASRVDTPKNMDIIELFEDEPSQGEVSKAIIRAIPWNSLMLDYGTGMGYVYDSVRDKIVSVLAFWAISEEDYNNTKSSYYFPIQWTLVDTELTLSEFNERIDQIKSDKDAYDTARRQFFDDIKWYKEVAPYVLAGARDICLIKEFKGDKIVKQHVDVESYSEPVAEKSLPLVGKTFASLCQIAGKPANKNAVSELDVDYFIDWTNCLIWDVSRDTKGGFLGLYKAFKFSLKQDVTQPLPILLTKYRSADADSEFKEKHEFVDYLNSTYGREGKIEYKEAYITALENRGFTLVSLNDYDAFLDELATKREENRFSLTTPEPPINGNDNLDKTDYLSTKIHNENMLDATNTRYNLDKVFTTMLENVSRGMTDINEFLKIHEGFSLQEAGLTPYMNLLAAIKTKIDTFKREREVSKTISITNKEAVLDALTKDDEAIEKLAEDYWGYVTAKVGDVLTSSGHIYRVKKDEKTGEDVYTLVGQWRPVLTSGNIIAEFDINKTSVNTTHLDELFGLTLPVLISREKITVQILKYRTVICKNGNQRIVKTSKII